MAKKDDDNGKDANAERKSAKRKRFVGGDYDLEQFGLTSDDETHKQGFVEPGEVRNLLTEFGLEDREHLEFPLHHIGKNGYEVWSLRIEPAAMHEVKGESALSHQWIYRREQPESVSGAA